MNTIAVVVTHNRHELLARCLDNIQAQVCKPDEVLVINNASSDGTVEMLQQREVLFITQDNVGSAGGWARGIQYALDKDFDALWLMDDDGFPDKYALERLVLNFAPDIACVSSVVVREDDPHKFVFPFPILSKNHFPVLLSYKRKITTLAELNTRVDGGVYDFAHLFNGALINIRAVQSIGNVNTDYFIFGDEVDYFFRLREFGHVQSVLDAIHYHPDVTSRPYTPQKVYYYVKNTIILHGKYFDQVLLRNVFAIAAAIWRTTRRNGLGTAIRYIGGGEGQILYRAIWRGLAGSLGKDY